jgi:L-fuculose-phosphate aldolase
VGGTVPSPELSSLRDDVRFAARVLAEELSDIWGHVTVRLPENEVEGFLLKHLRIPGPGIHPDEVMVFDYQGRKISGDQDDPWEIPLYTSVYRARPDARSVIHVHPPVATALATTGRAIHAVSHEGLELGDGIAIFDGDIIDTDELGDGVAKVLGDGPACMLKGHGAVIVGRSVPHATVLALYLERTASQLVWAASVGTPEVLPARIRDHILQRRGNDEPQLWRYLQWRDRRDGP